MAAAAPERTVPLGRLEPLKIAVVPAFVGLWAAMGPGVIWAALAQGSGEIIWWPYLTAKYGATFLGRRRPTAGRRPSCRLKSAFQGAMRQASAFADAKDNPPVGAGRPLAEGLSRPNSFGAQADHRPKAFVPMEIGLPRRCTPSVGLRRRKRRSSVGAGRPPAEGLRADY